MPPTLTPSKASAPVDQARAMTAPICEKEWAKKLAAYRTPRLKRSLFELAVTAVPFLVLWLGALIGVKLGYWPSLLLALPAAAFLVRLFMIQHDCGHGSFFKRRWANDIVGRVIGVLTLTPYDDWRRSHAQHHAGSGNLDRRGVGDIDLLTVAEYRAPAVRPPPRLSPVAQRHRSPGDRADLRLHPASAPAERPVPRRSPGMDQHALDQSRHRRPPDRPRPSWSGSVRCFSCICRSR